MKELIDKISSYNLFNNLFPGIIFAVIAEQITSYSFIQKDLVHGVFLYYFIGLVISRVGSLTIEPFLIYVGFLKLEDYNDYVHASKEDEFIELFSEIKNMYRSLSSLFISLLLLKLYEVFIKNYPTMKMCSSIVVVIALLIIFLLSYRKQGEYINKRIKAFKNKTSD